jgi:hypothetical protein
MVIVMNLRRWSLLFAPLLISTLLPVGACAASLGEVHTVYLFPMAKGLDQYLANRLTQDHIFKVVTDPTAADAILTDKLGPSFEYALLHVRPELKPPPPPKKETEKKDDDSAKKDEPKKDDAPITSTFGAANGTVFLVDAKTRQVIWSTLEQPKHSGTKDVVKTATRIVKRLELDINPPVKK